MTKILEATSFGDNFDHRGRLVRRESEGQTGPRNGCFGRARRGNGAVAGGHVAHTLWARRGIFPKLKTPLRRCERTLQTMVAHSS